MSEIKPEEKKALHVVLGFSVLFILGCFLLIIGSAAAASMVWVFKLIVGS